MAQQLTKECPTPNCPNKIRYYSDWKTPPKFCSECARKQNEKWEVRKCIHPECQASFMVNVVDWETIPVICNKCREKNKESRLTKECFMCGGIIYYYPEWEKIPWRCPKCHEDFKKNIITLSCQCCRYDFTWNKLWLGHDENLPKFCPKCQNDSFMEFIRDHQSQNSYEVNNDTAFYESINQIFHFLHGTTAESHIWDDGYEDPEFIIAAAAQIASSTEDGVLEFRNNMDGKDYIIKYDLKTTQVVIFNNAGVIITTYMIHQGLSVVTSKLANQEWVACKKTT